MSNDIKRPFGFLVVRPHVGNSVPEVIIDPLDVKSVYQIGDGNTPYVRMGDGAKFALFGVSFEEFGKMLDTAMRERFERKEKP